MAPFSVFTKPSIRRSGGFQPSKDFSFGRPSRRRLRGRPAVRGSAGDVSLEGPLDKGYLQDNFGSGVASAAPASVFSAEELAEREAELTASVPDLLDQMNSAGKENNKLKVELSRARDRYDKRDKQFKQLYEEVRKEYGQAVVDTAEPYFKATQELTTVSHRVHTAVGEFKAAAARYCQAKADLKELEDQVNTSLKDDSATAIAKQGSDAASVFRATEKVEKTREERDQKETAYANALQDYRAAQEVAEAQRAHVGDATIRAAQPGFRRLHSQQVELSIEKVHMDTIEAKSETARWVYSETLVELDRISTLVTQVRQEFERWSAVATGDSSDSNGGSVDGFSDPSAAAPELPVCVA